MSELTDGTWVWPVDLAHFVSAHGIGLPDEFLLHARGNRFSIPPAVTRDDGSREGDLPVSHDAWLSWAERKNALRRPPSPPEQTRLREIRDQFHTALIGLIRARYGCADAAAREVQQCFERWQMDITIPVMLAQDGTLILSDDMLGQLDRCALMQGLRPTDARQSQGRIPPSAAADIQSGPPKLSDQELRALVDRRVTALGRRWYAETCMVGEPDGIWAHLRHPDEIDMADPPMPFFIDRADGLCVTMEEGDWRRTLHVMRLWSAADRPGFDAFMSGGDMDASPAWRDAWIRACLQGKHDRYAALEPGIPPHVPLPEPANSTPHDAPARRDEVATRSSFNLLPPGPMARIPYDMSFSAEQFARIRRGFLPQSMDDKWFVFYEEPLLTLGRSWTGHVVYQIEFGAAGERYAVRRALVSTGDQYYRRSDDVYEAQFLDSLIRYLLLEETEELQIPERPEPSIWMSSPAEALARLWGRLRRRFVAPSDTA